jgi:hypothetical protein
MMQVMLAFIRYGLPAIVVIGGVAVMIAGGNEDALIGGAGIVGAGLSIFLINLLFRVGVSGDRARDEEEEARAFFDRHGRWPDEPAPPPGHKVRPPHERPHHPSSRRGRAEPK